MAITSRKITTYAKNIVGLSDQPNKDGLTTAQLKAMFDGRTDEEVKTSINGIVDDLVATTDGASGADQIGATPLTGGTGNTVQEVLEEINGSTVHNTGDETVDGVKTFSSSPIVPTPTTDMQASTKKYVDDLDALNVHLAGVETVTGVKTFSVSPIVPAPTTDTQASTKKYVDDADVLKVNITDIVNDLTTGGTAVPLSAEQGKTLQGEVGTLASLTTTEKGSLVGAINEVDGHSDTNATSIGTLASLTTTEKTNLVGAINELDTDVGTNATAIGTLASLTTTEKTNLVGAINEVDADVGTNATAIGTLASLTTTEKTNLVGAINELDTDKVETSAITNTLTEITEGKVLDARQGKAISDKIGDQTYTEKNYIADGESATSSINKLDMQLKDTADLVSTNKDLIDTNTLKINEKTSYGVYTGLVVAQQTVADMTVKVSAGTIYMANGDRFAIDAVASLAVTVADATNPRVDIVYVSSTGVVSYLAGTAAATPSAPAVPAGGQKLAEITVGAGATTVVTANIVLRKKGLWGEDWITPTLLNGWTAVGDNIIKYFKDTLGNVHIRGEATTGTELTTIFTLPTGYRPSKRTMFSRPYNVSGTSHTSLIIQTTGDVLGGSTVVLIGEVVFKAEL